MKLIIFSFLLVFFLGLISVSSSDIIKMNLNEGKNNLHITSEKEFFVKDLILLNPDIEVISYINGNRTIGYINIFGGIGENFLIRNDINYEIISKSDAEIIFPLN
jgi:hypothetical protein